MSRSKVVITMKQQPTTTHSRDHRMPQSLKGNHRRGRGRSRYFSTSLSSQNFIVAKLSCVYVGMEDTKFSNLQFLYSSQDACRRRTSSELEEKEGREFPYLIRESVIQHKCKAEEGIVRMVCNGSPCIICLCQQIRLECNNEGLQKECPYRKIIPHRDLLIASLWEIALAGFLFLLSSFTQISWRFRKGLKMSMPKQGHHDRKRDILITNYFGQHILTKILMLRRDTLH